MLHGLLVMGCGTVPTVDLIFELCRLESYSVLRYISTTMEGFSSSEMPEDTSVSSCSGWLKDSIGISRGFNFRLAQHQIYNQCYVFQVKREGFE